MSAVIDRFGQQDSYVHERVRYDEALRYRTLASRAAKLKYDASTEADAPMWTMHEELVDQKAIRKHLRRSSRIEDILCCIVGVGCCMVCHHVLSRRMSAKSKLV